MVEHTITSARGVVLRGGFVPRVAWHPTNRISRVDGTELRVIREREFPRDWTHAAD